MGSAEKEMIDINEDFPELNVKRREVIRIISFLPSKNQRHFCVISFSLTEVATHT